MSCDYLRSVPIRRLPHPIEENPIWSVLGTVISSVVSVALSLPFLLAFLLVLPACLSVRWLLLFIHCNRQGSQTGPGPESVRGNDSRWLGTEWRSSVIHAVLVFEAKEGDNVDHFRRLLLKRVIPLYPRLTQRLISLPILAGVGNCWMTDAKFSIEQHVFPGPSFLSNEKDLQEYVSKLMADGLPEDKSPWQLQVFQSFGIGRDTVVILRVHQSVADGTALMRLLCHSLADSQIIEIPERPRSGSLTFCMNVFRACFVGPLTLLLWIFFSGDDCNLLTHRSTWTGSVTVTWSASITLPKVIRIKQVTRSTVNCVLLSALAGALRRLLQGCGVKQPPDVKVVVPMDLRDQTSASPMGTKLGNKTSPLIMPLPVAVEGCVPRLWATRKTLDSQRTSADPVILYVATAALTSIGSASFARHLVNFFTDKASLQFSSLPGPTAEVSLEGQTLKGIYPILPAQANLGMSITTITYADQVFVSVLAERALGPAAELILEYLEDQIEILWKLLLNRRVPGEQESSNLYGRIERSESPVREISAKFNSSQMEGDHLNESRDVDKAGKMSTLKAELSELVDELKRRQSVSENDRKDQSKGSSTTANSKYTACQQRPSNSSPSLDFNRPENLNLNLNRQRIQAGAGDEASREKDCVVDISDNQFSSNYATCEKSNNPYRYEGGSTKPEKLKRTTHLSNTKFKSDKSKRVKSKSSSPNGFDVPDTRTDRVGWEPVASGSEPDPFGEDPRHQVRSSPRTSAAELTGPNESNCDLTYQKHLDSCMRSERDLFQVFCPSYEISIQEKADDSEEAEILGGVLI